MVNKKLNKKKFLEFSKNFQVNYPMPGAYAVGQPFYEDGKLIAVRWQTVNIDREKQTAKNLGFCSAVMDFHKIYLGIKEISSLIIDPIIAESLLGTYFSGFLNEPGHLNLEIIQGAIKRNENVFLLFYPTQYLLQQPPVDFVDASCRLAMISHLAFKPNEINLDGVFGLLPILCYMSNGGVMTPEEWNKKLLSGDLSSHPMCIDKFPPMWWGTPIIDGVRIADTSRVRMGAYLPSGCTVMHEGFVNFNAGSKGPAMIEGRISAGVFTGADSDIGGGASIMGTLSGGGKEKITIGDNCLLGANSGIGISLGDRCTVEAGLYVTAGMYVKVKDARFGFVWNSVIKAINLSGKDDMLFIQNSKNGAVEVLYNKKPNKLNLVLHS